MLTKHDFICAFNNCRIFMSNKISITQCGNLAIFLFSVTLILVTSNQFWLIRSKIGIVTILEALNFDFRKCVKNFLKFKIHSY